MDIEFNPLPRDEGPRPIPPYEDELHKSALKSGIVLEAKAYELENGEVFRVQSSQDGEALELSFGEKPSNLTRAVLKSHAFQWRPERGVWGTPLTTHGLEALDDLLSVLEASSEE